MKFFFGITLLLAAALTSRAADEPAKTNAPAAPMRAGRLQIWDADDSLGLTPEQKLNIEILHINNEAAEKQYRTGLTATNLTIEKRLQLRKDYMAAISNENARIEVVLTPEQKAKFLDMKKAEAKAARAARSQEERKAESNPEYDALANKLRAQYSQPATNWPKPTIDPGVHFVELGLLPETQFPTNNPFSTNKAALGKMLFFDPRMSASRQIACASCHDPDLSWGDGRTVGFGHERKELRRNVPSISNAGLSKSLFWDGRADSLEAQVRDVLLNQDEMLGDEPVIQKRLSQMTGYKDAFVKAFGDDTVSVSRVAQAVATFERTIVSRRSDFDSFLKGDTNALSDAAVRGLHLFRTSGRCINCHNGPTLSDGLFHNNGLSYYGRKFEDLGRYSITKKAEDVGAFKTPSLRNVTRTGPYMHNGLFDLDGVLRLYNAGMPTLTPKESQKNDPLFPVKSKLLQPLHFNTHDLADLKAFLESLEETRQRMRPPELPAELTSAAH